uniref:Uncharacterized protein n=1 Tax=Peronospora matthiolae TaxID=2874970 RepID=A0AAV1TMH4_9STRA
MAAPVVLAYLVVLSTVVLTLEIHRHRLLARALGALVMLIAFALLPPLELQLKAACCAIVYHGITEGLRQWTHDFPCVFERHHEQKLLLWLLFWARVVLWGATLAGLAVSRTLFTPSTAQKRPDISSHFDWLEIVALALYYEVVEVLVMLYFADDELSYTWPGNRAGNWLAAVLVSALESSERLDEVVQGPLVAGTSPLALVAVLLLVMWLTVVIRWDAIAAASGRLRFFQLKMKKRTCSSKRVIEAISDDVVELVLERTLELASEDLCFSDGGGYSMEPLALEFDLIFIS